MSEEEMLFQAAYQRGIEKRAEDEANMIEAGISPEEAGPMLDAIAEQNPAAVLPPEAEAAPDMGGAAPELAEADPEMGGDVDSPEQLASALDEAGVTPDQLAEAVETVKSLEDAGVQPEEIIAAVQNAAGEAPVPAEKVAAARQGVIQEALGLLRAV
jgi:hypothetical protein